MAKCSECGFLALWHVHSRQFIETPEYFRAHGNMETDISPDNQEHQPNCFMQRAPLNGEVTASLAFAENRKAAVLSVISLDRPCQYDTPWIQGYSPREHREMLALAEQNRRHNFNLGIALFAVVVSVAGVVIGAHYNMKSAQIQADAQIRAAQMQIDAQKELSHQPAPPINVTVQIPQAEIKKR